MRRTHHHSRVLHSNTGGCGSKGPTDAMVVFEADFDLRCEAKGEKQLNPPRKRHARPSQVLLFYQFLPIPDEFSLFRFSLLPSFSQGLGMYTT